VRVSTKTTPAHRAPLAREMRSRISSRLQRDGLVSTTPEPASGAGADPALGAGG
jgi:hypothetical protein